MNISDKAITPILNQTNNASTPISDNKTIKHSNEINSINTLRSTIKIDLGIDLSSYKANDLKQEQINQDVNDSFLKFVGEDKHYSLNDYSAYNNNQGHFLPKITQEDFSNYLNKTSQSMGVSSTMYNRESIAPQTFESILYNDEVDFPDNIGVISEFKEISKQEYLSLINKSFQSHYNLTDEFATTEQFIEARDLYIVKSAELMAELKEQGTSTSEVFYNIKEDVISGHIISRDLTKTQWIQHLESQRDNVNEGLSNSSNINFNEVVKNDLKNYVSLYDAVIKDLKETWGYGDFDTYG